MVSPPEIERDITALWCVYIILMGFQYWNLGTLGSLFSYNIKLLAKGGIRCAKRMLIKNQWYLIQNHVCLSELGESVS